MNSARKIGKIIVWSLVAFILSGFADLFAAEAVDRSWVCIPAAVIGDQYWVYLNGKIVSSPPHTEGDPRAKAHYPYVSVSNNGLSIETAANESFTWGFLNSHWEHYDNLVNYLGSGLENKRQLFQKIELPQAPEKYTLEVVMLKEVGHRGGGTEGPVNSFPFVVTRKYIVDNSPDNVPLDEYYAQHFVAIPMRWTGKPDSPMRAHTVLRGPQSLPSPPDTTQLAEWMNAFSNDPMVKLLQDTKIEQVSQPNWIKILNLPESQGGPREFDRKQIGLIAQEILGRYYFPSHSDIKAAWRGSPEYSQAYAAYDKAISSMDNQLELFRKLAKFAK